MEKLNIHIITLLHTQFAFPEIGHRPKNQAETYNKNNLCKYTTKNWFKKTLKPYFYSVRFPLTTWKKEKEKKSSNPRKINSWKPNHNSDDRAFGAAV